MIPKIIHHLSKTDFLSPRQMMVCESWQRHNRAFEFRLWTDQLLDDLIDSSFPRWKSIYTNYAFSICRVDLARYLIMYRFGGVYSDLDYECLKPADELLAGRQLIAGLEPNSHLEKVGLFEKASLQRIVCNAFIASERLHPFWSHLFEMLRMTCNADDVLDATGPFVFTRAFDSYTAQDVTILRPEFLYPLSKFDCWEGRNLDLQYFAEQTSGAFGCHYWEGSWFKPEITDESSLLKNISTKVAGTARVQARVTSAVGNATPPLVSCLMIWDGDKDSAKRSVADFKSQTYPNKELVIVASAVADMDWLKRQISADNVCSTLVQRGDLRQTGDLINLAREKAKGEYVCLWISGSYSDPLRLQIQLSTIAVTDSDAALLERQLVWRPAQDDFHISGRGHWNNTLVWYRDALPQFPSSYHSADDTFIQHLLEVCTVALIDLPRIYLEVIDSVSPGEQALGEGGFRFSGENYSKILFEADKRLKFLDTHNKGCEPPVQSQTTTEVSGSLPKVIVLTPMKNCKTYVATYFQLLDGLDYPASLLNLAFLEGDSTDGTFEEVTRLLPAHRARFNRVFAGQNNENFHFTHPRWANDIQNERRSVIARARNQLMMQAVRDEDWVLWLDADLVDYPADLLKAMLGVRKPIVVPHCVLPDGRTFDLNTFRFDPDRLAAENSEYLIDGYYRPPKGAGRRYLDSFIKEPLARLDSVGGTGLLVQADLHRNGLNFPPENYRGYNETEGLAMMAADMGIEIWGLPQLKIVHAMR